VGGLDGPEAVGLMGRRRTREPHTAFGKFLLAQLEEQGLEASVFAERAGLSVSDVYQPTRRSV
jgi:predicted transcriptional regulator